MDNFSDELDSGPYGRHSPEWREETQIIPVGKGERKGEREGGVKGKSGDGTQQLGSR